MVKIETLGIVGSFEYLAVTLPTKKYDLTKNELPEGAEYVGPLAGMIELYKVKSSVNRPSEVDEKAAPVPWPSQRDARKNRLFCMDQDVRLSLVEYNKRIPSRFHNIVAGWINDLTQSFRLPPRILSAWAYLFARVMNVIPPADIKDKIQLYAIACFSMAAKAEYDYGTTGLDLWNLSVQVGFMPDQYSGADQQVIQLNSFQVFTPSLDRVLDEALDRAQVTPDSKTREYWVRLAIVTMIFPEFSVFVVAEAILSLMYPQFQPLDSQCRDKLLEYHQKPSSIKAIDKIQKTGAEIQVPTSEDRKKLSETQLAPCRPGLPGQTSRSYQEEEFLGKGAYGKVVRVSTPEKKFARKDSGESTADGFEDAPLIEISLFSLLSHPNIVEIFDPTIRENRISYFMDLYSPFQIPQIGLLPSQVRRYGRQLLSALAHMDANDVLHRDLKPANLLLQTADDALRIADLGLGFLAFGDQRQDYNSGVSTLWYRAPEVLLGIPYNKGVDIWSLGCILLEMVIGSPPFPATHPSTVLAMILGGSPVIEERLFEDDRKFPSKEERFAKGEKILLQVPRYLPSFFKNRFQPPRPEWDSTQWNLLVDLLCQILAPHPDYRISPAVALEHAFFRQG